MTVARFCWLWALVVAVAAAGVIALGAAAGPSLFIAVVAVAAVVYPLGLVAAMHHDREKR